jgi:hypothetical protein
MEFTRGIAGAMARRIFQPNTTLGKERSDGYVDREIFSRGIEAAVR